MQDVKLRGFRKLKHRLVSFKLTRSKIDFVECLVIKRVSCPASLLIKRVICTPDVCAWI